MVSRARAPASPVPEATDIRPESGTPRAAELAVLGPWPPPAGRARCTVAGQHDGDGHGRREPDWKSSANRPPATSAATANPRHRPTRRTDHFGRADSTDKTGERADFIDKERT